MKLLKWKKNKNKYVGSVIKKIVIKDLNLVIAKDLFPIYTKNAWISGQQNNIIKIIKLFDVRTVNLNTYSQ